VLGLDQGISNLIGRIYECAHDAQRWSALLEDVRARLDARCLIQIVTDLGSAEVQNLSFIGDLKRPGAADEYRDFMSAYDPTIAWVMEHPHGRFCSSERFIPASGYLEHDFVRWNRDECIGTTHWMAGYTSPLSERTYGLSAHPNSSSGPFAPQQEKLFRLLFEHMERAARLVSSSAPLAMSEDAVLLLDASGLVRELSPRAEAIMGEGDGLTLEGGRLRVGAANADFALGAALRRARDAVTHGTVGGVAAVQRPSGKRPYIITTSPLPTSGGPFSDFGSVILLRICDGERGRVPQASERWSQLFGLTAREIAVAEALVAGHSVESLSHYLGIASNTARVHLRSIFRKTDTTRQLELVRLLADVARL